MNSKYALEEPNLIVDPEIGCDQYQVYTLTTLMPQYLFFPSFSYEGDLECKNQYKVVVMSEIQPEVS